MAGPVVAPRDSPADRFRVARKPGSKKSSPRSGNSGREPAASYPRTNCLNAVRLLLASSVVVDHARVIGGFGTDPRIGKISLGALAVFSFFGVSGFLIAGSGQTATSRQYLVNRVLRIFPGYWACLIVTAFLLCPIAAWGYGAHYPPVEAIEYVVKNIALKDVQPAIGGTLSAAPDADTWNASLWTLPFEFACYLGILGAAVTGLLRRRWPVCVVTALFGLALLPHLSPAESPTEYQGLMTQAIELVVMFGAGASIRLWRPRFRRASWPLAVVGVAIVAAGVTWFAHPVPIIAVPLIYVLLWLGANLSGPGLIRRHDLSYGIYIYGMPLQQVLTSLGANGHGEPIYDLLCFAVVLPVGALSWLLVERPAMSLKSLGGRRPAPLPPTGPAKRGEVIPPA